MDARGVVLRSGLELRCRKPTCPPLGGPPGPRLTTNGIVKRRKFWRFYVLKRVFLQRATHLGTQTEYLLAKYPESDPNAT